MENWARPYYVEFDQKPYLFFAAFCDLSPDKVAYGGSLSRGLDVRAVEATYFQDGHLWDQLCSENRTLAEQIKNTSQAFVVQGEIQKQTSLDYLHQVIEFLAYLVEEGACAVHDPFALRWFSGPEFLDRATAGQLFNPFDHVILLRSPEEEGSEWLHTRGMRKFGRPELSVHGVKESELTGVKNMIDRFINFLALGGTMEEGRPVKMEGLTSDFQVGPLSGDTEDPDFNNFHVELLRA